MMDTNLDIDKIITIIYIIMYNIKYVTTRKQLLSLWCLNFDY